MKASELIKKLEQSIQDHGDLDVLVWPNDGQSTLVEIGENSFDMHTITQESDTCVCGIGLNPEKINQPKVKINAFILEEGDDSKYIRLDSIN